MDRSNIVRFLNYAYHYKSNNPFADIYDFFTSQYLKDDNKLNIDFFKENKFTNEELKFVVPKTLKIFHCEDVEGVIAFMVAMEYEVILGVKNEIIKRVK